MLTKQNRFDPKGLLLLIGIPAATYVLMELICVIFFKTHVMKTVLDVSNFARNAGIGACAAFALSFNATSGRMDLSLSAQQMMSIIVGGTIALALGMGTFGILFFTIVVGLLGGSLVGLVFVTFRIPSMVLGIGMGLIYECITFTFFPNGLMLTGVDNIGILSDAKFVIIVVLAAALVVILILQYTKFGFHQRAVQGSQRIAKQSGIKLFKTVFLCYAFAGALIALAGVFDVAFKGTLAVELGTTSNGSIFGYMFPVLFGAFLTRWTKNQTLGILSGVLVNEVFLRGLSAMHLPFAAVSLFSMLLFLGFLIFRENYPIVKRNKLKVKRAKEAKAYRLSMGNSVTV